MAVMTSFIVEAAKLCGQTKNSLLVVDNGMGSWRMGEWGDGSETQAMMACGFLLCLGRLPHTVN